MPVELDLLPTLRDLLRSDGNVTLDTMALRSGWSRFHFHRAFRRVIGRDAQTIPVAHAPGTRRRRVDGHGRLSCSPFRERPASRAMRYLHAHSAAISAALRNATVSTRWPARRNRRVHVIVSSSRVRALVFACTTFRSTPCPGDRPCRCCPSNAKKSHRCRSCSCDVRLRAANCRRRLAECFGVVFPHCMKAGLAMAGFPLARYPVAGPGLITVEAGIPLVEPTAPVGDMQYCELPGGPVVFAVHGGPYDQLGDTHAAIERWIQEKDLRVARPSLGVVRDRSRRTPRSEGLANTHLLSARDVGSRRRPAQALRAVLPHGARSELARMDARLAPR